MVNPLKHFHQLSHSERNRILISDLDRNEAQLLYPQPVWCNHKHALDNHEGCIILLQGFVFDSDKICTYCENFNKEKYGIKG